MIGVSLAFAAAAVGQTALTIPSWAAPLPDAKIEVRTSNASLLDTEYRSAAKPQAVLDHYEKEFRDVGLPFVANFDGIGTSVRASTGGCDLFLRVRAEDNESVVRVSCAASKFGRSPYGQIVVPPAQEPQKPLVAQKTERTEKKKTGAESSAKPSTPKAEDDPTKTAKLI